MGDSNLQAKDQPAAAKTGRIVPLADIGFTFFRIGITSFSLAALGEAKRWLVEEKNWFTDEDYLQGVGFSQLLPGAPAVSLMMYLGYRLRGFWGSLVAATGYMIPAFFLMLLLGYLYARYNQYPVVKDLFTGLSALVVGLVLNTVLSLWQSGVKSKQNWILALGGFAMIYLAKLSIYWILLAATVTSIFFVYLRIHSTWWADKMAADGSSRDRAFTPQPVSWRSYGFTAGFVAAAVAVNTLVISTLPVFRDLGVTFMQLGGLVFGSGYAMLPFIQETAVSQFGWITSHDFTIALALSLVTPGPLTKIATFIGFKAAGLAGALVATVNIYLPTFGIINLTADFYRRAGQVTNIRLVIRGVVAAFIGTLWAVVIRLSTDIIVDFPTMFMAAGAVVMQRFTQIDTLWIILGGAVVSVVLFSIF